MATAEHVFYTPPPEDFLDLGGGLKGLLRAYETRSAGSRYLNQPYGTFQTPDKIYYLATLFTNTWIVDPVVPSDSAIDSRTTDLAIVVYDKATKTNSFHQVNNAAAALAQDVLYDDMAWDPDNNGIWLIGRENTDGADAWFLAFVDIATMEITSLARGSGGNENWQPEDLTVGEGKVRFVLRDVGDWYEAWTITSDLLRLTITMEPIAVSTTPDDNFNMGKLVVTPDVKFWGARVDALLGAGMVKITPPVGFTDAASIHDFIDLGPDGLDGVVKHSIRYDAETNTIVAIAVSNTETHPDDPAYKLYRLLGLDPILNLVVWTRDYYVDPNFTEGVVIANESSERGFTWILTRNSRDAGGVSTARWRKIDVETGEEVAVIDGSETGNWPEAEPWIGSPFFWDGTRESFYSPAEEAGQGQNGFAGRYLNPFGIYDGFSGGMWDVTTAVAVGDGPDMNPAHIILECLTNTEWGMGGPLTSIDLDSFHGAADVLWDERLGLSLMWAQQTDVESFIQEILDHIEATLFVNPRTGLVTLKLIRGDYDPATLPVLDETNCTVTAFQRKLWGDTINEIVVTWTNPESEKEEPVTYQDLGNITIQGAIVSQTRNYYGVRSAALAKKLAVRDIRAASAPLATAEVEANRIAWDFVPGGVVKLSIAEYGIASIVMRIVDLDYGKPGDSLIKLSLVEDVFALAPAQYVELAPPDLSGDTGAGETPAAIAHALLFTLPWYLALAQVDGAAAAEYPDVITGVLAAQSGSDTAEYELMGPLTDAAGTTALADLGTRTIVARGTLANTLTVAAQSVLTLADFGTLTQGDGPTVGGFLLIGGGAETANELCLIAALVAGSYTIKRGVLDTVPRTWAAGTPVWFFTRDTALADQEVRAALETVGYKILPRTSAGVLAEGDAALIDVTLTERPYLPSRPAAVQVAGVFFGLVDGGAALASSPPVVPVAWANRNRLTEDGVVLAWDAAGVTPEAGQTTTITVRNAADGTVLATHAGLAGSSFDLTEADFMTADSPPALVAEAIVKVTSARDGFASLQAFELHVVFDLATIGADTSAYTADTALLTADQG